MMQPTPPERAIYVNEEMEIFLIEGDNTTPLEAHPGFFSAVLDANPDIMGVVFHEFALRAPLNGNSISPYLTGSYLCGIAAAKGFDVIVIDIRHERSKLREILDSARARGTLERGAVRAAREQLRFAALELLRDLKLWRQETPQATSAVQFRAEDLQQQLQLRGLKNTQNPSGNPQGSPPGRGPGNPPGQGAPRP
jgi:hypothetical protein